MPLMICPERNCPRRQGCASALPHEKTSNCSEGCTLQSVRDKVIWSNNRKPCVPWRGKEYGELTYKDAKENAK
jgi:hypothetical protein